jgi:hypothetical protein
MSEQWTPILDESSGQTYYYNTVTGETSWEAPAAVTNDNLQATSVSLPPGWTQLYDEGSGTYYYYNEHTGLTSWEVPEASPAAVVIEQPTAALALPVGWTTITDPSSGQTYFYHADSGQTSWDPPPADAAPQLNDPSLASQFVQPQEVVHEHKNIESVALHPHQQQQEHWVEHADPTTGKVYYENSVTHVVQWESPYLSNNNHDHHPISRTNSIGKRIF